MLFVVVAVAPMLAMQVPVAKKTYRIMLAGHVVSADRMPVSASSNFPGSSSNTTFHVVERDQQTSVPPQLWSSTG